MGRPALAQGGASSSQQSAKADPKGDAAAGVSLPADYTIGAEDILNIVFWREPDMSAEVVVRPDGKISLPLLNEVVALGLTPEQLRATLTEQAKKLIADPNVVVVVKQINSRKVFITGMVERPGPYPLGGPTTVLQLIALAGGLREYADSKNIVIMRTEKGVSQSLPFNYNDISKRKNLHQNVELKPGDTVIVP
jgi:polysaccharide export outer membrane protein